MEAARCPKKTRTPMNLEPDSLRVSTWPRRTRVENSLPSRTTHSAAVAASHGAGDDVLGEVAEVSFEFRVSSFEFSWGHKNFFDNR